MLSNCSGLYSVSARHREGHNSVLTPADGCASCLQWYVDVVLALLERAGDFCSADVWHRMVQLVTNNEGSQSYAAEQVMEVLQRGASHEALVCLAAYVLGEYGKLVRVSCTGLVGVWWWHASTCRTTCCPAMSVADAAWTRETVRTSCVKILTLSCVLGLSCRAASAARSSLRCCMSATPW